MKDPSRPGIRLLGELQLVGCDGRAVALPASRKTRALLGYLIATGQLHRRERLCDLLWDGPDDPRAELRWSLSKIRAVLNDEEGMRLTADRERVGVELGNAVIDIQQVRSLLGDGVSAAPIAALKEAASLFGGGEFLDGLDLPLCYRYQEWCMAEREVVSRLRLAVLTTLVKRLQNHPGDALAYARALTTADPLSESGHAAVVRLLAREGRNKEALGHYEHASRLLEVELGVRPSAELEEARQTLRSTASATVAAKLPVRASGIPPVPGRSPLSAFVGREAERALIDQIVAMRADRPDVVLVTGEPGIGKSRILAHIGERVISAGGRAFAARAYEAEAARSYGVWIDVIREILRESPRDGLPADLSLLLPEMGAVAEAGDRTRLLDSVVGLLRQVVSARPAAVILDDLQWVDEGSSSLLHYVARHIDSGLLIVCAARAGEIEDNSAASRVLRSLARDGRLREIELAVEALIAGQLAPLAEGLRETLVWAAAHGRAFTPDDLARSARLDDTELLSALGELERRGLIRPVGGDAYDFTHDLVRQTAYRTLSQPRRKLLHRRIARALDAVIGRDGAFAADIAYHAALAEDDDMAAHACRLAGERALRQFANAEAASFAERGLRHAERLAEGPARLELRIAMLKIRVLGATGPGLRPLPPLADTIAEATSDAEALGLQAAAATGHYLLSVLHQEAGDVQQAETSTLRAAEAGRAADDTTRARQLANTARCLLELETEIGRSRALIAEASAIAGPISLELCELYWARGLLERWDGNDDHAVSSLGRALDLARRDKDRWREYKCLTWLAMLERERGRYADMHAHCAELETVAARLGDDETPFVKTLRALAGLATEEASADDALASALTRLRAVDDKSYLAYALNSAAHFYSQAGRTSQARLCASEALTVASAMRRHSEMAIARALLAPTGEAASAQDIEATSGRDDLSVRARAALLASQARPRDSNGGSHAKPAG
jgi:DNA-binding SARP family transcriptional activator/tetratricopeptide (TPR) repeat protein